MKSTVISAALLLAVADWSLGRGIPNGGLHERQVDLPGPLKHPQGNDIRSLGHDEHVAKRAAPPIRVPPAEGGAAGEAAGGAAGRPPPGEGSAGEGVLSQQHPNTEHGGSSEGGPSRGGAIGELGQPVEAGGSAAAAAVPDRIVAPKPAGLEEADESALWDDFGNKNPPTVEETDELILYTGGAAMREVNDFRDALRAQNPGVKYRSAGDLQMESDWGRHVDTYLNGHADKEFRLIGVLSAKYGEVVANHPKPVHILYSEANGVNLPPKSYLSMAEMGLVTAPGSKVPQIHRYEMATYKSTVQAGNAPIIWRNGDAQMSKPLADLTTDPVA